MKINHEFIVCQLATFVFDVLKDHKSDCMNSVCQFLCVSFRFDMLLPHMHFQLFCKSASSSDKCISNITRRESNIAPCVRSAGFVLFIGLRFAAWRMNEIRNLGSRRWVYMAEVTVRCVEHSRLLWLTFDLLLRYFVPPTAKYGF